MKLEIPPSYGVEYHEGASLNPKSPSFLSANKFGYVRPVCASSHAASAFCWITLNHISLPQYCNLSLIALLKAFRGLRVLS